MTKAYATDVIKRMLFEYECNSAWIDFSSENDEDVEKAEEWLEKREAMQMAIEALRR